MKLFDMALIMSIPAESYDAAQLKANKFLDDNLMLYPTTLVISFEHDDDGQRVLYLHPEEKGCQ